MKKELYLVLKSTNDAFLTLEKIKNEGYNATVVNTESLHHALDYYPGEHHFITLRHIEKAETLESILCLFIVDEEKVEDLKNIIRSYTNNFQKLKGFMYTRSIEDYEGSI